MDKKFVSDRERYGTAGTVGYGNHNDEAQFAIHFMIPVSHRNSKPKLELSKTFFSSVSLSFFFFTFFFFSF